MSVFQTSASLVGFHNKPWGVDGGLLSHDPHKPTPGLFNPLTFLFIALILKKSFIFGGPHRATDTSTDNLLAFGPFNLFPLRGKKKPQKTSLFLFCCGLHLS